MLKTSVVCFLASYGCAFGCELAQLKWRQWPWKILSLLMATAGLVAQTFYLLNRSRQSDLAPLLSSAHDWMLVLAWIVVLVYLFVSVADRQFATGLVIWPVVLALVFSAEFVTKSPSGDLDYLRGWKMLHASMLVLGTFGILQGFILSLTYLWQYRRLKYRKMTDDAVKLPNLEQIQRLNRWSILIAAPLLTIGVVSGFGLAVASKSNDWTTVWSDPVVIGGALTWSLMGILFLWLLMQNRSPGKQVAMLTVWSCGFLLVTIVGLEVLVAAVGSKGVHGAFADPAAARNDLNIPRNEN